MSPGTFTCRRQYKRAWRAANPDAVRKWAATKYAKNPALEIAKVSERARRRLYGVTADDVGVLSDLQGGRCAGCLKVFETTPHVDHSHIGAFVRGLLCCPCNHALGKAEDSPETLRRLASYVENPTVRWPIPRKPKA